MASASGRLDNQDHRSEATGFLEPGYRGGQAQTREIAADNSVKTSLSIPKAGGRSPKIPLPGFVKRELHDQGRCEPCLYHSKGGCWYGDGCRFCHFCTAEQIRKKQSRQHYMQRAQQRERAQAQVQGLSLIREVGKEISVCREIQTAFYFFVLAYCFLSCSIHESFCRVSAWW